MTFSSKSQRKKTVGKTISILWWDSLFDKFCLLIRIFCTEMQSKHSSNCKQNSNGVCLIDNDESWIWIIDAINVLS